MREISLRWFGHVYRKLVDLMVKKINCSEVTGVSRGDEEDLGKLR